MQEVIVTNEAKTSNHSPQEVPWPEKDMILSYSQWITPVSDASMLNVPRLAVAVWAFWVSFENSTVLPTECFCVLCTERTANSDYFPDSLVGEFTKWREATYSFVTSVCPSVIPLKQNSAPTGWIFITFEYFSKIFLENSVFNNWYLTWWRQHICNAISLNSTTTRSATNKTRTTKAHNFTFTD